MSVINKKKRPFLFGPIQEPLWWAGIILASAANATSGNISPKGWFVHFCIFLGGTLCGIAIIEASIKREMAEEENKI
jgi:hypothetical protein